jgi:hypothetical protein
MGATPVKAKTARIVRIRASKSLRFKQRQQFRAMLASIGRTALGTGRFQTYVMATDFASLRTHRPACGDGCA